MPRKTKIRKAEAPVYAIEDGNDRVTKNRSGTKIDRMTNMEVYPKRKPSGKGGAVRTTRKAKKNVFENLDFDDMDESDIEGFDDMTESDIDDPINLMNDQNDGFVANEVARFQQHSDEIAQHHNLERDSPVAPQELVRLRNEKCE